ncbi:hypothetical protein ABT336_16000 [Micromonospora sp. NPDC000207]|uniref:hypothetical protein n=1 Tax=Micromonospora sp. NPDC000207 TaxID=3154246 RepID=UPI003318A258
MVRPVTNIEFEGLLLSAGYTDGGHGAFARQVNHAGRAFGAWRYDAASVYWWLRGRRPAEQVQVAMTEILARKLGRPVQATELGFTTRYVSSQGAYPTSISQMIDTADRAWFELSRQISGHSVAAFQPGIALQAALAWRYDGTDHAADHAGKRPVTMADIKSLHVVAESFTDLDRRHGGGSARTRVMMADFLSHQVSPMLKGTYTDRTGRHLMRAAAVLSGQLAFMCYDAGDHGVAQHHVTIALRLAKAADDRHYGAHLLANLATQAIHLGHAQDAIRLAEAAIDGVGLPTPTIRARLYSTAASAYGRVGDRRACQKALSKAERALNQTVTDDNPSWATYFGPAHLAGAAIRCLGDLGLHRQALRHAVDAMALDATNSRTRALHTALIATTHAHAGDIDSACTWGNDLAVLAPQVNSARVTSRIRELCAHLSPHRTVRRVDEVLQCLTAEGTSPA